MRFPRKTRDSPVNQYGDPAALKAECERYQNRGGGGLPEKVHRSIH